MKDFESLEHQSFALIMLLRLVAENKGITDAQLSERTGIKDIDKIFNFEEDPLLIEFLAMVKELKLLLFLEDKDGDTDLAKLFNKAMDDLGRNPDVFPKN